MTIVAPLNSRVGRVSFRLFDPGADFSAAAELISGAHAHDPLAPLLFKAPLARCLLCLR